jgi:hypothetical protein
VHPDDDTPIYRRLSDELLLDLDPPAPQVAEPVADIPADIPAGAPPDEHDAGTAGHLGSVTDREWAQAHHRLMADAPDLAPELDYIWDPSTDGRALVAAVEQDMAPRPGRYDPGTDERFHGGGFRG